MRRNSIPLIEMSSRSTRNPEEDISIHVAKIQRLCIGLKDELKKQNENTQSEKNGHSRPCPFITSSTL